MTRDFEACTVCRFPHAFINRKGEAIVVKALDAKRHQQLIDMYLAYQPRNSFNGLPPIQDSRCVQWATDMIRDAINLVALSFEEGVVGHGAVFPIDERTCEMLTVVAPRFQNIGIGSHIVRCLSQLSHELGYERIWLSVDSLNLRARHVYKKCGFDYVSRDSDHVEMELDLQEYCTSVGVRVGEIMSRNVVTISPEDTCRAAVDLILEHQIATLPVIDEKHQLIGIISETDLIIPANYHRKVGEILTRQVISVREDCSISRVIQLFQGKRRRCIPVVDENMRLVGILGRKDILAYYASLQHP